MPNLLFNFADDSCEKEDHNEIKFPFARLLFHNPLHLVCVLVVSCTSHLYCRQRRSQMLNLPFNFGDDGCEQDDHYEIKFPLSIAVSVGAMKVGRVFFHILI